MDQKEHLSQFSRQLDRLLSGKALDSSLSESDQRTLELARRMSLANFSSESCIRDELYLRLMKSSATGKKPSIMPLPRLNFPSWAWSALVLMVLVIHSIGIRNPRPTFTATSLPVHVVLAMPSPGETTPSLVTDSQAIRPVPIPTPLAISAIEHTRNQPFLASSSTNQPPLLNTDRTQTPKPDPQPGSESRP